MEPGKTSIESEKDMEKNMGSVVEVTGIYKRMNLSKRPDKIVYGSRVYIQLRDTSTLALEIGDKGLRMEDEIKKFENKNVRVTGRLNDMAPLWGDGTVASIVSRYLSEIQKIEVVE